MTKRAFGELETQILFILRSKQRKTVRDVQLELGGQDNYNTVMTVMSRLVEKKLLAREKVGAQYEYWIVPATPSHSLLSAIKQKLFGVPASLLVSHLVETPNDLSDDDLDAMEALLRKARSGKK